MLTNFSLMFPSSSCNRVGEGGRDFRILHHFTDKKGYNRYYHEYIIIDSLSHIIFHISKFGLRGEAYNIPILNVTLFEMHEKV